MKRTSRLRMGAFAGALALLLLACGGGSGSPAPDGDAEGSPEGEESPEIETEGEAGSEAGPESEPDAETEEEADETPLKSAWECLNETGCRQVMVAAHRGGHREHPENSLAALRAAAALGADFVEVDVRDTLDGGLVLMHDGEVDRTTDGTGEVSSLTLAQIRALTLKDCETGNDESCRVPLFSEALALAKELGLMLYVDQKTSRTDWVLSEIQNGPYYSQALVRDNLDAILSMAAQDGELRVMPAVSTEGEFEQARSSIPGLRIVEISKTVADAAFTRMIVESGVKAQQDVMAIGDLRAMTGDYSGYEGFIEAGVTLLQTDIPETLIPLCRAYNRTGVFPEAPDLR